MNERFGRDGVGWLAGGFVIFWCTGYVVAKLSLPDAGPIRFLAFRFGIACIAMAVIAFAWRAPWPRHWREVADAALVGVLVHGLGLGGVWIAIDRGVEAGVAAIIMGTQPLLTAIAATVTLKERPTRRIMLGLALGFAGVVLVIQHKLGDGVGSALGLGVVAMAVVSMTSGTLYQIRRCAHLDLRASNAIQLLAAALLALGLLVIVDERSMHWTGAVLFSLAWSVFVLSIAATALFYWLFRHGAASQVASLLYLVPPLTALIAWADFGERIGAITIAGMVLASIGVGIVLTGNRPATGSEAGSG